MTVDKSLPQALNAETGGLQGDHMLRVLGSAVEQAKDAILITSADLDLPGAGNCALGFFSAIRFGILSRAEFNGPARYQNRLGRGPGTSGSFRCRENFGILYPCDNETFRIHTGGADR
jgi:hypothetical protein